MKSRRKFTAAFKAKVVLEVIREQELLSALSSKYELSREPTANLDGKSAETQLDIMEKLNKEENITFIFSTYDQRVMQKARRIITLEDGKIVR